MVRLLPIAAAILASALLASTIAPAKGPNRRNPEAGAYDAAGSREPQVELAKGIQLFKQSRMDEARHALEIAAEGGNRDAQALLGKLLVEGIFFEPEPEHALEYLRRAGMSGGAEAQFTLGTLYWHGLRLAGKYAIQPNPTEAARQFRLAAAQGMPLAAFIYAGMLLRPPENRTEATRLLQEAADAGYKPAAALLVALRLSREQSLSIEEKLASLLDYQYDDIGIVHTYIATLLLLTSPPRDRAEALPWLLSGGENGSPQAERRSEALGNEMSPASVRSARKQADEWYREAATKAHTFYAEAAEWCLHHAIAEIACFRTAMLDHQECRKPFGFPLMQDYLASPAYSACRRHLVERR